MTSEEGISALDNTYYRRKADELLEKRLRSIENVQSNHGVKLDKIEYRINILFGALGILTVVANLIVPIIAKAVGLP